MIVSATGDLLSTTADALVNPVNCVGVMGKGLALQFKQAFPDNWKAYRDACEARKVVPGRMLIRPSPTQPQSLRPWWIINFPTKRHWKDASRLEDIRAGLVDLVKHVRRLELESIAIPALGCGLGGLDWPCVRLLIVQAFEPLPEVRVLLFAPREG